MLIKDFLPENGFSEFVRCVRIVHMEPTRDVADFSKYYVPKPEMVLHAIVKGVQKICLTTTPAEEFDFSCFLSGQQTNPFILKNKGELLNVQIVFNPTAFFKITGIPSSEMANKFLDASLIFGDKIFSYQEQLQCEGSYDEMIHGVEKFMESILQNVITKKARIDHLFYQDVNSDNLCFIKKLAKEAFLVINNLNGFFMNRWELIQKCILKSYGFLKHIISKMPGLIGIGCVLRPNATFTIINIYPKIICGLQVTLLHSFTSKLNQSLLKGSSVLRMKFINNVFTN